MAAVAEAGASASPPQSPTPAPHPRPSARPLDPPSRPIRRTAMQLGVLAMRCESVGGKVAPRGWPPERDGGMGGGWGGGVREREEEDGGKGAWGIRRGQGWVTEAA